MVGAVLVLAAGCKTADPFSQAVKGRAVFLGNYVFVNLPDSQPVMVAGSSGTQVATRLDGGGSPATSGAPINNMEDVTVGQTKEVDVSQTLANLQDIMRSSAQAQPSSAQRQSTASPTGTSGDVTAPATTTVSPSVPVSVTGQGASSADAAAPPAPPAPVPAPAEPITDPQTRLDADQPTELVASTPTGRTPATNGLSRAMDRLSELSFPVSR
jgi:hypothetical protein